MARVLSKLGRCVGNWTRFLLDDFRERRRAPSCGGSASSSLTEDSSNVAFILFVLREERVYANGIEKGYCCVVVAAGLDV
mmetsp:Transcript_50059/g.76121  ORF Transcript_50059/g.76121 Transcript_50059/m.76121 type:complete len:80 (-) Transcript_50059:122-361(-)